MQDRQKQGRTAAFMPVDLTRAVHVTGPEGEFVAYIGGWGNLNAQPIRELLAFPDMLAALQDALDAYQDGTPSKAIPAIMAAIQKATGGAV